MHINLYRTSSRVNEKSEGILFSILTEIIFYFYGEICAHSIVF